MKRFVFFAFNGDSMCFAHVLLNALDFKQKGYDLTIVIEGAACALVDTLNKEDAPFHDLYVRVRDSGLIDCICEACSKKMGSADAAREQNIPFRSELQGHPSIAEYIRDGYEVITF